MNTSENVSDYGIRFLGPNEFEEVVQFQNLIVDEVGDLNRFCPVTQEFLRQQLMQEKNVLGLMKYDKLIGIHVCHFPKKNEENLGTDIDLSPVQLTNVAVMGPAAVHPEYRGNYFLNEMGKLHIQIIKEAGYGHICCTVSPFNYPSLNFLMSQGFVIRRIKYKFNNLLRCIMHLNMYDEAKRTPIQYIKNRDIEFQQQLIQKGLCGFNLIKTKSGFDIVYG